MTTSVLVIDDEALLRTAFSALIDAEDPSIAHDYLP